MKCKYCQQELEEGITLCPHCGKENAEAVEETAEAAVTDTAEEIKEEPKPGIGKIALALGVLVALVVLLGSMIMGGTETKEDPSLETETTGEITELTEGTEPTEPATVPADTGLNDATCKGTYTVTNEELLSNLDAVVATMADRKMTVADLQVYYSMQYRNFIQSEDAYFLYYYYQAFDPAQPMDTQVCYFDETLTWQQYFVDQAIGAWQEFTAMAIAAEEAGCEMQEDLRADLDGLEEALQTAALEGGFADINELLEYNMGPGTTFEAYKNYWEVYYLGFSYYNQQCEQLKPTEDEILAHYQENAESYAAQGITEDQKTYDVRHVLIVPEGGTTDATTGLTVYTDEEWAAAEAEAQRLLDEWLAGGATEDAFAEMANTYSADSDGTDGGLYTGLSESTNFVTEFKDWYLNEERQVGDSGLVKSVYGWHIMYFSASNPVWYSTVEEELLYNRIGEVMDAALVKYELIKDYSNAMLGNTQPEEQ